MSSLIVLTALVGSTLFVSYVPKLKEAQVCLSDKKTETSDCYVPLKLSNLNNSYPVLIHSIDKIRLTYNNYFKAKYFFYDNKTLSSDWIELPTNQKTCNYTFCYMFIISLTILSIILATWILYKCYINW